MVDLSNSYVNVYQAGYITLSMWVLHQENHRWSSHERIPRPNSHESVKAVAAPAAAPLFHEAWLVCGCKLPTGYQSTDDVGLNTALYWDGWDGWGRFGALSAVKKSWFFKCTPKNDGRKKVTSAFPHPYLPSPALPASACARAGTEEGSSHARGAGTSVGEGEGGAGQQRWIDGRNRDGSHMPSIWYHLALKDVEGIPIQRALTPGCMIISSKMTWNSESLPGHGAWGMVFPRSRWFPPHQADMSEPLLVERSEVPKAACKKGHSWISRMSPMKSGE